jgi:hypothetical protein
MWDPPNRAAYEIRDIEIAIGAVEREGVGIVDGAGSGKPLDLTPWLDTVDAAGGLVRGKDRGESPADGIDSEPVRGETRTPRYEVHAQHFAVVRRVAADLA